MPTVRMATNMPWAPDEMEKACKALSTTTASLSKLPESCVQALVIPITMTHGGTSEPSASIELFNIGMEVAAVGDKFVAEYGRVVSDLVCRSTSQKIKRERIYVSLNRTEAAQIGWCEGDSTTFATRWGVPKQLPSLLTNKPQCDVKLKESGSTVLLESYLACLQAHDVERTAQLFAADAVVRVVNQTNSSYGVFRNRVGVREMCTWLIGLLARSGRGLQAEKMFALSADRGTLAVSFCAWDCPGSGLTNGSIVCVYNESGQILRQNLVLDVDPKRLGVVPSCFIQGDALNASKPALGQAAPSINASFTHHFSTFGGGVAKDEHGNIPAPNATADEQMKDFAADAVLSTYNHVSNTHTVLSCSDKIRNYFVQLYPNFTDPSDMDGYVWDVEEPSGQIPGMAFLAFRNPKSGMLGGTDTWFFDNSHKIIRQFTVEVFDPVVCNPKTEELSGRGGQSRWRFFC